MSELLRVSNLHISIGERALLENVSLAVNKGEPLVILVKQGQVKACCLSGSWRVLILHYRARVRLLFTRGDEYGGAAPYSLG